MAASQRLRINAAQNALEQSPHEITRFPTNEKQLQVLGMYATYRTGKLQN